MGSQQPFPVLRLQLCFCHKPHFPPYSSTRKSVLQRVAEAWKPRYNTLLNLKWVRLTGLSNDNILKNIKMVCKNCVLILILLNYINKRPIKIYGFITKWSGCMSSWPTTCRDKEGGQWENISYSKVLKTKKKVTVNQMNYL